MLTLRRFNNILSVCTVIIALYLLLTPLLGNAVLWIKRHTDHNAGYVYKSKLAPKKINGSLQAIPPDNRLVIPTIGLNEHIYEGRSPYTLSKGIWHMPGSGDPSQGGNMVMLGHRFTYRGPAVLFNLDKLVAGQRYTIFWNRVEYDYHIDTVRVVSPYDMSITEPTARPTVTVYTCTPLWTSKQRLVIEATPIKV